MDNMEKVFSELRSLRKELEGAFRFSALPRAMKYERAAEALDIKLTVLKQLVKQGVIHTVQYHEGGHPRIPVEEIERLTKVKPLAMEAPRGHRSRKRSSAASKENSPAATREALKKL